MINKIDIFNLYYKLNTINFVNLFIYYIYFLGKYIALHVLPVTRFVNQSITLLT